MNTIKKEVICYIQTNESVHQFSNNHWDKAHLKYFLIKFNDNEKEIFGKALLEWMKVAKDNKIKLLLEITNQKNQSDVNVRKGFPGFWSYVGSACKGQKVSMNLEDVSEGSIPDILHEIGHSLGLLHEHQHPDSELDWSESFVLLYCQQFYGWDEKMIKINIFDQPKYASKTFYDKESIMHYHLPDNFFMTKKDFHKNIKISKKDGLYLRTLFRDHSDSDVYLDHVMTLCEHENLIHINRNQQISLSRQVSMHNHEMKQEINQIKNQNEAQNKLLTQMMTEGFKRLESMILLSKVPEVQLSSPRHKKSKTNQNIEKDDI